MKTYFIAWWNLENLFDVYNSSKRPPYLQKQLKSELKGWTAAVLKQKISQLKKVIERMNGGNGPDILGVCEVENKPVVDKLLRAIKIPGRTYAVEHHDTKDKRGIDVAFIYDRKKFTASKDFSHFILKRSATRDLYQVNFKTKSGKQLVLIGNHWPSRSAGTYESEPYRILAGETMSYWNMRILEELGKDVAVIAMGDFNDNPFNRSLTDYALSSHIRKRVTGARTPVMFNLMWPLMGEGKGTHYYGTEVSILDQFLISKGLLTGAGKFKLVNGDNGLPDVRIEMYPDMRTSSRNPAPKRFGRPSSKLDRKGFSDHYPISMVIKET